MKTVNAETTADKRGGEITSPSSIQKGQSDVD